MKSKVLLIMLSFLLVTSLSFVVSAKAATPVKAIELKIAHYLPDGHHLVVRTKKIGAEIEKRTEGKVKFTYYSAGTLVGPVEAFEGTLKRRTDLYFDVVPGWTPGRFPLTELVDLAPNNSDAEGASIAFWEFYNKFLIEEWNKVKVVGVTVQVPQHLHTRVPIRTFADLKGKQIRIYGAGKQMMAAWGGTPVGMPISEAYLALQKGIVEGILCPFTEMKYLKFADVAKYHTVIGVLASPFMMIMNLDSYNALPPDVKKVFDGIGEYIAREAGKAWNIAEAESREHVKGLGQEIIVLPPAERAEWVKRAVSINDAWVTDVEAKGLPAKKILEEKNKIWAKYLK